MTNFAHSVLQGIPLIPFPITSLFLQTPPCCPLASLPLGLCPLSENHPAETSTCQPKSLASFCLRTLKIYQVHNLQYSPFLKIKSAKHVKDQIKGHSCCSLSCRQVFKRDVLPEAQPEIRQQGNSDQGATENVWDPECSSGHFQEPQSFSFQRGFYFLGHGMPFSPLFKHD